ncbi:hypothetical protein LJC20_05570, partial [Eubacteriales bacterium OttesenSCG-928-M02]|nr:hypothetical protein [Eubacteriales bacterium OttesenSCG-928-M02]
MKDGIITAYLSQLIIAVLTGMGALWCFIAAFAIPVNGFLVLAVGIFSSAMALSLRFLRGHTRLAVFIILMVLGGALLLWSFPHLASDALQAGERVNIIYLRELRRISEQAAETRLWSLAADITRLFLPISYLTGMYFAWAAGRRRRVGPLFVGALFFLAIPLFLTITPPWPALLCTILGLSAAVLTSLSRQMEGDTGPFLIYAISGVAMLMAGLLLLSPIQNYQRSTWVTAMRERLLTHDVTGNENGSSSTDSPTIETIPWETQYQMEQKFSVLSSAGNRSYTGATMLW